MVLQSTQTNLIQNFITFPKLNQTFQTSNITFKQLKTFPMQVSLTASVIGPIGSGKTTLLNSYINKQDDIFPTAGFEIKYVSCGLKPVLIYDSSGQFRSMPNWHMFSNMADAVIYVIDSADLDTFSIAKKYLFKFLQTNKNMKKKNLCIILNKSDIKDRPPKDALYKALEPDKIQKLVSKLYVKEASGYNKDGLEECLDWLIKNNTTVNMSNN